MMAERPPRLSDLSTLQIRRAEVIARAAEPFGLEAVKAALMCAFEESSFLIYANDGSSKRVDVPTAAKVVAATSQQYAHDKVAPQAWASPTGTWDTTADSVGHFQQRPMFGYGSVAELMDPAESTRIFLRGSKGGRGFTKYYLDPRNTGKDIAARIQWAQGSEFPTGDNYRPNEQLADELIARFGITKTKDWSDMATKDEVKAAFGDALKKNPLLRVVKMKETGVDYAWGYGTFFKIQTEDQFQALYWAGILGSQHGEPRPVEDIVVVGEIRNFALRTAARPDQIDAIEGA